MPCENGYRLKQVSSTQNWITKSNRSVSHFVFVANIGKKQKKWPKVKHFSYFTKLAQIAECLHICQHFLDGRVAKDVTSSLLSRSAVLRMPSPTTTSSVESNYFSLTERKYVVLLITKGKTGGSSEQTKPFAVSFCAG